MQSDFHQCEHGLGRSTHCPSCCAVEVVNRALAALRWRLEQTHRQLEEERRENARLREQLCPTGKVA